MIHSAELKKYVLIRSRTDISIGAYEIEQKTVNRFYTFAKIVHAKASTYFSSAQIDNTVTHYITIRSRQDNTLTIDDEIVFKNNIYRIKRVRKLEESTDFLLIECEEIGINE